MRSTPSAFRRGTEIASRPSRPVPENLNLLQGYARGNRRRRLRPWRRPATPGEAHRLRPARCRPATSSLQSRGVARQASHVDAGLEQPWDKPPANVSSGAGDQHGCSFDWAFGKFIARNNLGPRISTRAPIRRILNNDSLSVQSASAPNPFEP